MFGEAEDTLAVKLVFAANEDKKTKLTVFIRLVFLLHRDGTIR